ncbi:unnamed protein product [Pedinophyceae sp. YPF-701]|nr:unnamed protein product [Pedinophyceae sp. YPF-701]
MSRHPASSVTRPNAHVVAPVATFLSSSVEEATGARAPDAPEIKTYKLGKRKYSYNEIDIRLIDMDTRRTLCVAEARRMSTGSGSMFAAPAPRSVQDASIAYAARLETGLMVCVGIWAVREDPVATCRALDELCHAPGGPAPAHATPGAGASVLASPGMRQAAAALTGRRFPPDAAPEGAAGSGDAEASKAFFWEPLKREQCAKGCQGPILRPIQRFGRASTGRRPNDGMGAGGATSVADLHRGGALKDPKKVYVSVDEACTHIDVQRIRLLLAVYEHATGCMIASGVTEPIRALANNDVPDGAAKISVTVPLVPGAGGFLANSAAGNAASTPTSLAAPGATRRRRSLRPVLASLNTLGDVGTPYTPHSGRRGQASGGAAELESVSDTPMSTPRYPAVAPSASRGRSPPSAGNALSTPPSSPLAKRRRSAASVSPPRNGANAAATPRPRGKAPGLAGASGAVVLGGPGSCFRPFGGAGGQAAAAGDEGPMLTGRGGREGAGGLGGGEGGGSAAESDQGVVGEVLRSRKGALGAGGSPQRAVAPAGDAETA